MYVPSLTVNGATAATQSWVQSQNYLTSNNISLPSTFTAAPTSNTLGYLTKVQNTSPIVPMPNANTCYPFYSMAITAGTWLIWGSICISAMNNNGGNPVQVTVQAGISIGSTSSFDDIGSTIVLPMTMTYPQCTLLPLPQRYYSGNGTTVYANASISVANSLFGTYTYPNTMNAVRIA